MAEEIELKFEVKDYKSFVKDVLNICKFIKSAIELTVMYDYPNKILFNKDARLRLRKIVDLKDNKETCELSYKKPKTREGIKIEEEYEVQVSSFDQMDLILKNIGFLKISSYERVRDTFVGDNCKITLDSFPFGDFIEIEGEIDKIKFIAKKLKLDIDKNITKSYDDIYADLSKRDKKEVKDHLVFDKPLLLEKVELRKSI